MWFNASLFNLIIQYLFIHFPEYTTYARIEVTKNGYRHLLHHGYTYGETKVTDKYIHWRCTANIRDAINKSKRCAVQVTTKIRNGYEMLRKSNVKHTHEPKVKYDKNWK